MGWQLKSLVVTTLWSLVVAQKRGTPPTIQIPGGNQWRDSKEYIRMGNAQTIQCLADGNPVPKYMWRVEDRITGRIEEVIDNGMVKYDHISGVLTATEQFDYSQDAKYSCIAINEFGKAMTPPISIETAVVSTFPGDDNVPPEIMRAYVSQSVKMVCKNAANLKSKPPFEIRWQRGNWGGDELVAQKLELRENMAVDPEGSLHFLWVNEEDFGYVYVCAAFNKKLLSTYRNTRSIKLERISGQGAAREPSIAYIADVTAMAGTTAELTCIFSYYSLSGAKLSITWRHLGNQVGTGQVLPVPVKVPDKKQDVSGEYMCEAKLGQVIRPEYLKLTIISPPEFIESESLQPISVPLGKDAVFRCGTSSYKTYQEPPVWYVNADKLLDCEDPSQMVCQERKADGSIKCVGRCDGFPQCDNEEDEKKCEATSCTEGTKLCRGQCIKQDVPCPASPECMWPSFQCKDQLKCVGKNEVCNGVKACQDGSDEEFCPGGEPIQVKRFIVSSDRKELTLPRVTFNDQMCFQCSVKNRYGMVFGDACLTVIDKIEVLIRPNDTYNVEPGVFLNIGVDATTDKLYSQMKFNWVMYNETEDEEGNIHEVVIPFPFTPYDQYFHVSQSGKNLTVIIPDVSEDDTTMDKYNAYVEMTRERRYAVNISYQFEFVTINFTIIGINVTIKGVEITPPIKVPVLETILPYRWFIAINLAVLILHVVIPLIVCYMYRNRGGTYHSIHWTRKSTRPTIILHRN